MEAVLSTKLGKFYIRYSEKGLSLLSFTIPSKVESITAKAPLVKLLTQELNEFAEGRLKVFTTPLDIVGTDFQKSVWKQLKKIKYGEVKSYGEIAKAIKVDGGQRAVGGANNKNKIPIIIPCHRVIKSDGGLGGYAGGLDLKRRLLKIEGVALKE